MTSLAIPRLLTIADLQQPIEVRAPLIGRAMQISDLYDKWKSLEQGGYSYTVESHPPKARPPGIHASEIGCPRRISYSVRDEPKMPASGDDVDLMFKRKFGVGHALHAMLQKEFELTCHWVNTMAGDVVITFESEVRISPETGELAKKWGMYSHCDGRFIWWWHGHPYIQLGCEIKTKSAPEFEKITKPEDDHFEQTCFYQAALDIPLMWVVYYNKSNSNYTHSEPPWLYQFDYALWSQTLEPRFKMALEHAQAGSLPDRNEGIYCKWCPWAYTCKPNIVRYTGPTGITKNPGAFRLPVKT